MKRVAGGFCLVLGVGIAVFGLGMLIEGETGGPFTMALGAMLFALGVLLWRR